MIQFHTVEDVLRFALMLQESSRKFYLHLSEAVAEPAVQAVFTALAQAEERRKKVLELELFKIGATVSKADAAQRGPLEDWPEPVLLGEPMSVKDAFELAMQRQRESFHLFAEWMGKADKPEIADIFFQLSQEEMRHLLQLEKEYKSIFPERTV